MSVLRITLNDLLKLHLKLTPWLVHICFSLCEILNDCVRNNMLNNLVVGSKRMI